MAGSRWDAAEAELVRVFVEQGKNDAQIVEKLQSVNIKRTYKAVQRLRQRRGWHAQIPEAKFTLGAPVTLQADRALLLFDIHAPYQNAPWLNRVIDLALKWKVSACGIGGDLIDFSSCNYYGRTVGMEFDEELAAAQGVIRAIDRCFKSVVLCGGNHEYRLVRKMDNAPTLQTILDNLLAAPGTITTFRKWFLLESGGETYRVVHPKNYSRIPARNSQRLATKYHQHVVAGHNHLWGQTREESNTWHAIDAGCCLDADRISWIETEATNYPKPVLGAVIVVDGVPVLIGPENIGLYEGAAL